MRAIDSMGVTREIGIPKTQSEILFVMDSVGWKEFKKARTPNIDKLGKAEEATSPSFYTLPSVHCMFRGLIPQPLNRTFWAYGRYSMAENSLVPMTYANNGYNTYLLSSNPAVTNKEVGMGKEVISYNPYFMFDNDRNYDTFSTKRLFDWFLDNVKFPFWCFMIVIETHTPYLGKNNKNSTQIEAIENLDKQIGYFIEKFKKIKPKDQDVRMIICSDHSEAWENEGTSEEKNKGHNPRRFSEYVRNNKLERLTKVPLVVGKL